jgi:hypothetical protein
VLSNDNSKKKLNFFLFQIISMLLVCFNAILLKIKIYIYIYIYNFNIFFIKKIF